jgi:hypothetical protein
MNNVTVKQGGHTLSFVKESDLIDIEGLIKEISASGKKVWFWVADQLGRGEYIDDVVGGHYLDAGASYALDGINRNNHEVWATGKNDTYINNHIAKSDYLFIISGSPLRSKMFNKQVFDLFIKRVGNFDKFKRAVLKVSKVGVINTILGSVGSFNELKDSVDRKVLLNAIDACKGKKTALRDVLIKFNAFLDYDKLRDGFYLDNDFKQNDIMLVLKPSKAGGLSNHSTYENSVMGEVVGVPDKKINAYNLMLDTIKKQYDLNLAQQSQVVAPYGSAVRELQY